MRIRPILLEAYVRVERRLTPELRYSQESYQEVIEHYLNADTVWLDVGCGRHLLPPWKGREERHLVRGVSRIVGMDLDTEALAGHRSIDLRLAGDLVSLPFPDGSFDLVTANMVVEHLSQPDQAFREVARVLRPGGRLLFHTPNARSYLIRLGRWIPGPAKDGLIRLLEGRQSKDVFRTFYRANTPEAVREFAESAGLVARKVLLVPTNASFAMVLPLAALELLWIRMTMTERLARHRTNLIAVLEKPAAPSSLAGSSASLRGD